ncbi:MAG: hypothetical protein K2H20_04340 [Bacilli bacterium]|nr:hypothetical protein [Bacilli bacterium]
MRSKLYVPNKGVSVDFGESKIHTISDGIYKEFKENISLSTRRRKKERLRYLERFEYLKQYYPKIEYFVEWLMGLYIKGYVMKEVESKHFDSYLINPEEKISLLKQTREILKMFKNIGLMYYDIHLGNINRNQNGLPIFFDIDSILYIDESIPDITPHGFQHYECYGGKLDEKFQRVKFNVLVQEVLSPYQEITYDKVGQEMIDYQLNVYNPNSIYANEELIDHILTK